MKLKIILLLKLNEEPMSKILSKYITSFDYLDKSLTALSVTTGTISIASFGTVIAAPVGMASVRFSFAFLISTAIENKNCKKQQEIRKKSMIKLLR